MTKWNRADAMALCSVIEGFCPQFGCHVALTGGLLYREGDRKDFDILFYRIRQTPEIDMVGLKSALTNIGFWCDPKSFGWCHKATFNGKPIDMFFPEEQASESDQYQSNKQPEIKIDLEPFQT